GGTLEALSRPTAASIPAEQTAPSKLVQPSFSHQSWGHTPDGSPVEIYSLRNAKGMEVRVTTYGAAIVSLTAPDRDGHMADVVLGFDSIEGYTSRAYLRQSPYFGAVIGRYANRINKGRFQLDGKPLFL